MGRQVAVTATHMATDRRNAALKAKTGSFLDAFIVFGTGREFEFVLRFIDKLGGEAFRLKGAGDIAGLIERAGFCQLLLFTFEATLAGEDFRPFTEENGPCDDRRQNQANHHHLNDNIGMMIHTPNGEIRLHQIITHALSPRR
ncbi:Uncharacterised protein [Klebsiella pneumoniae]|nr:Uncharacterised protein [Klebsiella pneumoniae]